MNTKTIVERASEARTYIRKWADYWYNRCGDSYAICLYDKWVQQLDDEPQSIELLMTSPIFAMVLANAMGVI